MSAPKDSTKAESGDTIKKSPSRDMPNATESGATPKLALTNSFAKVESGKSPEECVSDAPTETESGESLNN